MAHMIACPECGQTLQVPGELIGAAVQCPQCRHAFTAAAPAESAQPKDAPVASKPPPEKSEEKAEKDHARADDADEPKPYPARHDVKPGHVAGMGIMALIGGIGAIMIALALGGFGLGTMGVCCLWPGTYYSMYVGILAIVRGSALLASNAHEQEVPRTLAILMIINIINGDMVCFVLGIIMLTFCGEKEVIEYLRKPAAAAGRRVRETHR